VITKYLHVPSAVKTDSKQCMQGNFGDSWYDQW